MAGVVGFSALDTTRVDPSTVQHAEGVSCVLVVCLATRLHVKRVSLPLALTFCQAKIYHQLASLWTILRHETSN
jgi:hypothetical protein